MRAHWLHSLTVPTRFEEDVLKEGDLILIEFAPRLALLIHNIDALRLRVGDEAAWFSLWRLLIVLTI